MADLKGHATAMIEAFSNGDLDRFMNLAGDATYNEVGTGRSVSGDAYREALVGWACSPHYRCACVDSEVHRMRRGLSGW